MNALERTKTSLQNVDKLNDEDYLNHLSDAIETFMQSIGYPMSIIEGDASLYFSIVLQSNLKKRVCADTAKKLANFLGSRVVFEMMDIGYKLEIEVKR